MKTINWSYLSCVKLNAKFLVKSITNDIFNSKSLMSIWEKILTRLTIITFNNQAFKVIRGNSVTFNYFLTIILIIMFKIYST